eukprot:jgi/Ulvmu1/9176/UM005_0276.1
MIVVGVHQRLDALRPRDARGDIRCRCTPLQRRMDRARVHNSGSQLSQFRKMTSVMLSSNDASRVSRYGPDATTINPISLLEVVDLPEHELTVKRALEDEYSRPDEIIDRHPYSGVAERVAAAVGARLLDAAPGPLSTTCDPRAAHDADAMTDRARRLVGLHASHGFHGRVAVTLPATWPGLRAAEQLEREGIPTNISHVFSIAQAAAASDVSPSQITASLRPPSEAHVGTVTSIDLDTAEAAAGFCDPAAQGPCDAGAVAAVRRIYHYCKRHGAATRVAVAGVHSTAEALAVAGADAITLSPRMFRQLAAASGPVPRALHPLPLSEPCQDQRMVGMAEATFQQLLQEDPAAAQALEAALRAEVEAQEALEERLASMAAAWHLELRPRRSLVYAD